MNQHDSYINKIHEQLDELTLTLDDLEKTIKEKSHQAHVAYTNEMTDLRIKLVELRSKLDELKAASADNWESLKEHIEVLHRAFVSTYSYFKEEVKRNELKKEQIL